MDSSDTQRLRYANLKARQRAERDTWPEALALRVHRALSWLHRAEMAEQEDPDSRFIFLWIAFNAAYATEIDPDHRLSEQAAFNGFLQKLCDLDSEGRLAALVWDTFPGALRVLLDNPYVFDTFWEAQRGRLTESEWQTAFNRARRAANQALARQDTARVLAIALSRVYTLRNQLVHGGATWNGSVNRSQLRDCVALLAALVPVVIEVMMDNPRTLWGEACFPVVRAV